MLEAKDVPFEPSALSRVTINPWMPQAVFRLGEGAVVGD